MNMAGACWMRRTLGEPVSALLIDSQNNVIAGGWNGRLTKWDASGDEIWTVQLPDRIGCISINEDSVYATAGLHLSAVNLLSGEIQWQHALEGSADIVQANRGFVYAVSSVYDIEHNDFIDSAIWCFDLSGNQIWETHTAERPWTLDIHNDALYLGLGRPKMGYLKVSQEGESHYYSLESDTPVTSAILTDKGVLFGHANGDLTNLAGRKYSGSGESIGQICLTSNQSVIFSDNQQIVQLNESFSELSRIIVGPITALSAGFYVAGEETVWMGIQDGNSGILRATSLTDNKEIASMRVGKINTIKSNGKRVVVGDEFGEVCVWEEELFNRRVDSEQPEAEDARRQTMRERLNALRKR